MSGTWFESRFAAAADGSLQIQSSSGATTWAELSSGRLFGARGVCAAGELVFTTAMTSIVETCSDPSFVGQIVVIASPLVGNYGVPDDADVAAFESLDGKPKLAALIVAELCPSESPSHFRAAQTLSAWLARHGVVGLTGVDTRALVLHLRSQGHALARVGATAGDALARTAFVDINLRPLALSVCVRAPLVLEPTTGKPLVASIVALDAGVKMESIRILRSAGCRVTLIPADGAGVDVDALIAGADGLYISNGPGDPALLHETIALLRRAMKRHATLPIFGICLGCQLLALAAGSETSKMKYGHRSHNQPVVSIENARCYVTSQNHGYAVDGGTLCDGWLPLALNCNDGTIEGVVHTSRPWFGVQFHPEAHGGPRDTHFYFERFVNAAIRRREMPTATPAPLFALPASEPLFAQSQLMLESTKDAHEDTPLPAKVLVLGSGGITIGQAGEFDFSGSQCLKSLRELGVRTVLVNPNIATVQTHGDSADETYLVPLTVEAVSAVIAKEKPDAIMLQFGGQSALNLGLALREAGVLEAHGVRVLGTPLDAIHITEDREAFAALLRGAGIPVLQSAACTSLESAVKEALVIGYPLVVRAAFALGGLGSGVVADEAELRTLVTRALSLSPQVLVERSVAGWHEVEYEVLRDAYDNSVTVCNMQNICPMGIHTGDSFVVSPSQTLDDEDYHALRSCAIACARLVGIVGECNVQFALDTRSRQFYVIEMNARLSRSSALASKATGFPIASIAARLALGGKLPRLRNAVTSAATSANFEPALDYVVVKAPRWDLSKFSGAHDNALGTQMSSVGEAMAIGRTFQEAFFKALSCIGAVPPHVARSYDELPLDELVRSLGRATPLRLFALVACLRRGATVDQVHAAAAGIDRFWIEALAETAAIERVLRGAAADAALVLQAPAPAPLAPERVAALARLVRRAKQLGVDDARLAELLQLDAQRDDGRRLRNALKVAPVVKQIDTLAGEFQARANYLYVTYGNSIDSNGQSDREPDEDGVTLVLGSGVYRIGASVEFDYGAVTATRTLRRLGMRTAIVNCNPETVSTDYDESERLYFEPVTRERVLDICALERVQGVVVSFSGQIGNDLAAPLEAAHVNVLGTRPADIGRAEDRHKFGALLDNAKLDQPVWCEVRTAAGALEFSRRVGYPVLVRPSFVLSGSNMAVCRSEADLQLYMSKVDGLVGAAADVVVTKFEESARELEFDAVAADGRVLAGIVSEHVEWAGVHSGDATHVLPPHTASREDQDRVRAVGARVAQLLRVSGPMNMQLLLCADGSLKVIECNVRASRSLPFASKLTGIDLADMATRVLAGHPVAPVPVARTVPRITGVKCSVFSWTRVANADPLLSVEMQSTGEVGCIGADVLDALAKSMTAAHTAVPTRGAFVLLHGVAGEAEALRAVATTLARSSALAARIVAAPGDAARAVLGVENVGVASEQDMFSPQGARFVISLCGRRYDAQPDEGMRIRRTAVDRGASLLVDSRLALLAAQAAVAAVERGISLDSWHDTVQRGRPQQLIVRDAAPAVAAATVAAAAADGGRQADAKAPAAGVPHIYGGRLAPLAVAPAAALPPSGVKARHLLRMHDLTVAELRRVVSLSARVHGMPRVTTSRLLAGRTVALLFEKPSLRTRVAFEAGVAQLGGSVVYINSADIGGRIGTREPIDDVANVLSGMCDVIVARVFDHAVVEALAARAGVPVINALSDREHPTQAIADVLTMAERGVLDVNLADVHGAPTGRKASPPTVAFVGDGNNNVTRSLAHAVSMLGASFACASPASRQLDSDTIELASKVAAHANAAARVVATQSAVAAVTGADVVYTDTYVSMGDEAQKAELLATFGDSYRVTTKLMQAAKSTAVFLHDMPAYRGVEVDAAVIDGPQSAIVQQAHNRMHSIKAILLFVLGLEDSLEQ